jgi:hypothetical protein
LSIPFPYSMLWTMPHRWNSQNIHSRNSHERAARITYSMFFFKQHISLCQQVLHGPWSIGYISLYSNKFYKNEPWVSPCYIHFRSCNCGFVFCHDFLKILVEVGEWIKYMEKQILPKTDFPFKSYNKKLVFCEEWAASFLTRHKGKKLFFPNPCGQLLRNFLHMFS